MHFQTSRHFLILLPLPEGLSSLVGSVNFYTSFKAQPKYHLLDENIHEPLLVFLPISFLAFMHYQSYCSLMNHVSVSPCAIVIQEDNNVFFTVSLAAIMAPGTYGINESVTKFIGTSQNSPGKTFCSYMGFNPSSVKQGFPSLLNPLFILVNAVFRK